MSITGDDPSSLDELGGNLDLLEMDHEQTTAHVHGIHDAQFGPRIDEHLRLVASP